MREKHCWFLKASTTATAVPTTASSVEGTVRKLHFVSTRNSVTNTDQASSHEVSTAV